MWQKRQKGNPNQDCPSFERMLSLAEQLRGGLLPSKKRFASLGIGYYRSVHVGYGSDDFAELREYYQGDDERLIDWNAFARTGDLYVRQYYASIPAPLWLVLDNSPSMRLRIAWSEASCTKLQYALRLALVLASAFIRNGLKVGALASMSTSKSPLVIPPKALPTQLFNLLALFRQIEADTTGASTFFRDLLENPLHQLSQPAGLIIISDFLGRERLEEWRVTFQVLAQQHQLFGVRLVDPAEKRLPYWGVIKLVHVERDETLVIDTDDPQRRQEYQRAAQAIEKEIANTFLRASAPGVSITTDLPLEEATLGIIRVLDHKVNRGEREIPPGLRLLS